MAEDYIADALARAATEELRKQTREWSAHHALRHWHLTQLGNKSISRAREHLMRSNFDSYYPMVLISRALAKSKISPSKRKMASLFREYRKEPMFGGYLFVRVDLKVDRWQQAFREAGVYGIACCGGNAPYAGNLASEGEVEPITCDDLVDRLMANEHDGAIPGATKLSDIFQIGELVRVASGPFYGFNATIDDINEKDIASVSIEMLGRSVRMSMEFTDFEKV